MDIWLAIYSVVQLGYADDASILAPSLYALRRMCDICSDYGLEYNLQFNPAKCKLLNFSQRRDVFFSFSNEYVSVVDCCKHLGYFVGPGARNTLYRDAAHNLVRRVNAVLSNFSHCNIVWRLCMHRPGRRRVVGGLMSGLQKLSRGFLRLIALLPTLSSPGSLYSGLPQSSPSSSTPYSFLYYKSLLRW